MEHEIKIREVYLKNLISGKKTAEIRYNDRDYQLGDTLAFYNEDRFEIDDHKFLITHIHSGLGMKDCFVCLSVMPIEPPNTKG